MDEGKKELLEGQGVAKVVLRTWKLCGPGVSPVSIEAQNGTGVPPVFAETEKTGGTPVPPSEALR